MSYELSTFKSFTHKSLLDFGETFFTYQKAQLNDVVHMCALTRRYFKCFPPQIMFFFTIAACFIAWSVQEASDIGSLPVPYYDRICDPNPSKPTPQGINPL